MRTLSLAQQAALADPATQLCTIWTITRTDAVVLRLTDLDVPLEADGETYLPNGSTERSSVRLSTGLAADNLDISGIFSTDQIEEADLLAGLFDYAQLLVSIAFAALDLPSIPLASGRFGEVSVDNSQYRVEINGLTQLLQATVGEVTSAACRAVVAPVGNQRHVPHNGIERGRGLGVVSEVPHPGKDFFLAR